MTIPEAQPAKYGEFALWWVYTGTAQIQRIVAQYLTRLRVATVTSASVRSEKSALLP